MKCHQQSFFQLSSDVLFYADALDHRIKKALGQDADDEALLRVKTQAMAGLAKAEFLHCPPYKNTGGRMKKLGCGDCPLTLYMALCAAVLSQDEGYEKQDPLDFSQRALRGLATMPEDGRASVESNEPLGKGLASFSKKMIDAIVGKSDKRAVKFFMGSRGKTGRSR